MDYDIVPQTESRDVVSTTRLSPQEDFRFRIDAMKKRCDFGPEALSVEIAYISEAYQSGAIPKKDYSGFLDELLDLRRKLDGRSAREESDRLGLR